MLKGIAGAGLVLLGVGVGLYLLKNEAGFLFVVFLGLLFLVYHWYLGKFMFFIVPYYLGLHPFVHMVTIGLGIPLFIYLSPILWMFRKYFPENIFGLGFGASVFIYVSGLVIGKIVSSKFLRYASKSERKKELKGKEEKFTAEPENDKTKNEEYEKLFRFLYEFSPEVLAKRIVGQDYALNEVAKAIRMGIRLAERDVKRRRVLTSMIFVGATGVGKTETAKALAEALEPFGYQFIRVDLNMYRTQESVWTLLGSPRGYVGSEYGGELTRKLMKNPRAVILFDEMEKAHPELHTAFMTLLDEGYVEEISSGRKVYLEYSIVIFTSNLYAKEIAELVQNISDEIELEMELREFVEKYFGRPELVGRIDKIIPFRNLTEKDLEEIIANALYRHNPLYVRYAHDLTKALKVVEERYGVRGVLRKVEELAIEGEEKIKEFIKRNEIKKSVSGLILTDEEFKN